MALQRNDGGPPDGGWRPPAPVPAPTHASVSAAPVPLNVQITVDGLRVLASGLVVLGRGQEVELVLSEAGATLRVNVAFTERPGRPATIDGRVVGADTLRLEVVNHGVSMTTGTQSMIQLGTHHEMDFYLSLGTVGLVREGTFCFVYTFYVG